MTDDQTKQERGAVYGPHHEGGTNVGRTWGAILSQYWGHPVEDIPADIVDLMMASMKICRASTKTGRGHEDSLHDSRVYIGMAKESADILKENLT